MKVDKELQLLHLKNSLPSYAFEMLEFVKETLQGIDYNYYSKTKSVINFDRFLHTKRVLAWAVRIYNNHSLKDKLDYEAIIISAIFHDVGYCHIEDLDHHGKYSAIICEEYLTKLSFDKEKIEFIKYLISNHSNKDKMLNDPSTPNELVILMEADLFDEVGILGLVEDSFYVAKKNNCDFSEVYLRFMEHTYFTNEWNPMVNEYSRKAWEENTKLYEMIRLHFIEELGAEDEKN